MSKYTTEVRFICEQSASLTESCGLNDIDSIVLNAIPKVFNNFEIFDETYRNVLCSKILKHYYTREICAETVGLWKLWLNNRMNEIMPYYNRLYKSELLEFNPFYDVDLTREYNKTGNGTENKTETNTDNITNGRTVNTNNDTTFTGNIKSENTDTGENYNLYSDTPQGGLDGVNSETYLTNARKIKDTSNSENETNTNNSNVNTIETTENSTSERTGTNTGNKEVASLEKYIETITGKRGDENYSDLLIKFRENFINIDMMIINDLSDLFLNLW